ncbi:MAG: Esterase/lipase, partial [uncultured Thermomicrobiales bacterium]
VLLRSVRIPGPGRVRSRPGGPPDPARSDDRRRQGGGCGCPRRCRPVRPRRLDREPVDPGPRGHPGRRRRHRHPERADGRGVGRLRRFRQPAAADRRPAGGTRAAELRRCLPNGALEPRRGGARRSRRHHHDPDPWSGGRPGRARLHPRRRRPVPGDCLLPRRRVRDRQHHDLRKLLPRPGQRRRRRGRLGWLPPGAGEPVPGRGRRRLRRDPVPHRQRRTRQRRSGAGRGRRRERRRQPGRRRLPARPRSGRRAAGPPVAGLPDHHLRAGRRRRRLARRWLALPQPGRASLVRRLLPAGPDQHRRVAAAGRPLRSAAGDDHPGRDRPVARPGRGLRPSPGRRGRRRHRHHLRGRHPRILRYDARGRRGGGRRRRIRRPPPGVLRRGRRRDGRRRERGDAGGV